MTDTNGNKVLVRSRDDRMLAGVCAGLADYFGVDVTLVRVIWAVVSVLTSGLRPGLPGRVGHHPRRRPEEPDRREHRQRQAGRLVRLTGT